MTRSKTTRSLSRWAGSRSDVARVARSAIELVDEQVQSEVTCQLTVQLHGLEIRYEEIGEFEDGVTDRDLGEVEQIVIVVEGETQSDLWVVVRFERAVAGLGGGVTLFVAGHDRTTVEGVTTRLDAIIREGRAAPWMSGTPIAAVFASVFTLPLFLLIPLGAFDWTLDWPSWYFDALYFAYLAMVGAFAAAIFFVGPSLELLAEGRPTRLQRWKKRFAWLVGVIVVAVIGTLVAKVANVL